MGADAQTGEIVIYHEKGGDSGLTVKLENETVWLTQKQMMLLFKSTQQNISLHIKNIFEEGELDKKSVHKENLYTAADGKQYRTSYYNLDVIISVGYRVKSIHGVRFRQWATRVLRDHITKGYTLNKDRMQELENLYQYLKDTMTITTININRLRIDSPTRKEIAALSARIDTIKAELESMKKKAK